MARQPQSPAQPYNFQSEAKWHSYFQQCDRRFTMYWIHFVQEHQRDVLLLGLDIQNIREALKTAVTQKYHQEYVRGVNALYQYLEVCGFYESARQYLAFAETLLSFLQEPDDKVMWMLNQGRIEAKTGNYEKADVLFQEGLKAARSLKGGEEVLALLLQNLGLAAIHRGDYPRAEEYLCEGADIADKVANHHIYCAILGNLSLSASNQGNYEQAGKWASQSLQIAQDRGNSDLTVSALNTLGAISVHQAAYDAALDYFQSALTIAQRAGAKMRTSLTLTNLGATLLNLGQLEQARTFILQSLSVAREIGDKLSVCMALVNAAEISDQLGSFQQAYETIHECLSIAQAIGHSGIQGYSLILLGAIESHLNRDESAENHLLEGLASARHLNHPDDVCLALANLAELVSKKGDFVRATIYIEEGVAISRGMQHLFLLALCLRIRGYACIAQNQFELARDALTEAHHLVVEHAYQIEKAYGLFGLAQVAWAQGKPENAHQLAKESLGIFTMSNHRERETVSRWLAGIG